MLKLLLQVFYMKRNKAHLPASNGRIRITLQTAQLFSSPRSQRLRATHPIERKHPINTNNNQNNEQ